MIKKKLTIVLFVVFALTILSVGCETTNCMIRGSCYTAEGLTKDIRGIPTNIRNIPKNVKNLPSDMRNLWQAILRADSWLQDNLW